MNARHFLKPYLPLAVVGALFVLMAVTVQPADRALQRAAGTARVPTAVNSDGTLTADGDAADADPSTPGVQAPSGERADGAAPAVVGACGDRTQQVPGDPYSPPCIAFSGDNGGATHQGVTGDEIVIAVRQLEGPSASEIFADISGESVSDSPEAITDTTLALAEYFSQRFNFYGRKLKIVFFRGQGSGVNELLGGGKEKALADAVQTAKEIGAFADLSAITIPYADALARNGVVALGAPYPSRKWFEEHRPYAWSLFPDGTNVVEASSSWTIARLKDQGVAEWAGPGLQGQPRKLALIAPENAEYQESVNSYLGLLGDAGINVGLNIKYKLDINTMPNQGASIVAQLKDAGVTTVICGCDPVMLALGLTPKANEQDYNPEWLTAGLAFADQDIISQLIDQGQWSRAFGIAYNAESEPQGRSYPYAAYKQMRPNDEPSFGVEELYYQMYILALGIHMAGPDLDPETFEAGLFAYPGGTGPRGTWRFGPGDYTPTDDFREIWWSTEASSAQNNKPGAWVQLNNGQRYLPGQVPVGRPPMFE
ncbi:MAG TPA: ABC transporter substrate-binding protein [Acidimicrobiales bacterium]|nr:ABC transporter substrate-binding protein [Acidimicrobiales bacterium]